MMNSLFTVVMTTLLVSSALGYQAGEKRIVLMEDYDGTCLQDPGCYDAVANVLAEMWNGGGRNLRGSEERHLCPAWCVGEAAEEYLCEFIHNCRRRQLFGDSFFSDSPSPNSEYTSFLHDIENTCWGDAGIGTDIAITRKVKKALAGTNYNTADVSYRMQVYKCFN